MNDNFTKFAKYIILKGVFYFENNFLIVTKKDSQTWWNQTRYKICS